MPYRLVAFDFDGTLADSFAFFLGALGEVAREHRFRAPAPEEVPLLRQCSTREVMRRLQVPAWKLPAVARSFMGRMQHSSQRVPLFPGSAELLRTLAAHQVPLALVTSNARVNVEAVLGPQLMALFAHVDCGASILGKAPRLRRLARRAAVPGGQVLYIGDQGADAEAAHHAGMAFGAVTWGYATPEALAQAGPRHLFGEMRHIAEVVLGLPPAQPAAPDSDSKAATQLA
ncbi:HAD hydrolase-like protein [Eleftheria terrae]|uniref:HAD hydrolase-like protein n=1 Tax=Eleftheria terrae TaxID=1597781 RepID=UPI00263B2081|nr:HAD hydrolase-like protein [Eleftheria terrae]WKB51433.1 HAD hydrolase-like protein [Eleftheria terrae]